MIGTGFQPGAQVALQLASRPFLPLYNMMIARGKMRRWIARLTRRSNHLLDAQEVLMDRPVKSRHFIGVQPVCIDQIIASESRVKDFDRAFYPLSSHEKSRWLSVAQAIGSGVVLPAIELIKVGDIYIVRDGHHRISVYRALQMSYIDARVVEWEVD